MPNPFMIGALPGPPLAVGGKMTTVKGGEANSAPDPKLREACESFESIFLHQLFKQMRATIPESGLLDGGAAKEIYTDMMDGEVSRELASGNGIGLARVLEGQLRHPAVNPKLPEKP